MPDSEEQQLEDELAQAERSLAVAQVKKEDARRLESLALLKGLQETKAAEDAAKRIAEAENEAEQQRLLLETQQAEADRQNEQRLLNIVEGQKNSAADGVRSQAADEASRQKVLAEQKQREALETEFRDEQNEAVFDPNALFWCYGTVRSSRLVPTYDTPLGNAEISVFLPDGTTPAKLYADPEGRNEITQPYKADSEGAVSFYIKAGTILAEVRANGEINRTYFVNAPFEGMFRREQTFYYMHRGAWKKFENYTHAMYCKFVSKTQVWADVKSKRG